MLTKAASTETAASLGAMLSGTDELSDRRQSIVGALLWSARQCYPAIPLGVNMTY
eukprot:COSAG02_NODE_6197_length_3735_cov_148.018427_4_plen_55_part_00